MAWMFCGGQPYSAPLASAKRSLPSVVEGTWEKFSMCDTGRPGSGTAGSPFVVLLYRTASESLGRAAPARQP